MLTCRGPRRSRGGGGNTDDGRYGDDSLREDRVERRKIHDGGSKSKSKHRHSHGRPRRRISSSAGGSDDDDPADDRLLPTFSGDGQGRGSTADGVPSSYRVIAEVSRPLTCAGGDNERTYSISCSDCSARSGELALSPTRVTEPSANEAAVALLVGDASTGLGDAVLETQSRMDSWGGGASWRDGEAASTRTLESREGSGR